MDVSTHTTRHSPAFRPAVGRSPGDASHAVAVSESLPDLAAAGDLVVGVVDTGLVLDSSHRPHPWFGDHVCFGPEDEDTLPAYAARRLVLGEADGHGTFVTGLVLHEAPTARVTMRAALDKQVAREARRLGSDEDQRVAAALRELAREDGLRVVCLAFSGGPFDETSAPQVADALRDLHRAGVAVVAAAGNQGSDVPTWPGSFEDVIPVGALDESRVLVPGATPPQAAFSNFGDWVDTWAGGVQVLGPFVEFTESGADEFGFQPPQHFRGWARWSGTSFAAARVAGRIARMAGDGQASGVEAFARLRDLSRRIDQYGAVWIRGVDSPPLEAG